MGSVPLLGSIIGNLRVKMCLIFGTWGPKEACPAVMTASPDLSPQWPFLIFILRNTFIRDRRYCNKILSLCLAPNNSQKGRFRDFFPPHFSSILSFQRVEAVFSHVAFLLHHDCQHLKENLKLPSIAINWTGCCMAGWALYHACVSPAKTKGIKNCVEMKALHFWLL